MHRAVAKSGSNFWSSANMLTTVSREDDDLPTGHALPIRNILVVVDPTADQHFCIEKASRIALTVGARIELFVCDIEPTRWEDSTTASSLESFHDQRRRTVEESLEDLAEPMRLRGIAVTIAYEWHGPLETGIAEHVLRRAPDLVIKDTHRHTTVARGPVNRTDWTLITQLSAPLLLVRPEPWPAHLQVAVATDPCHEAYRPESLDETLISTACLLANATAGTVCALHVLQTPPHLPGDSVPPIESARAHGNARSAVERLVGHSSNMAAPVPIHYLDGSVTASIVTFVKAARPDLLVIGAAARGRWRGSTAGGTAALILEEVPCDVLIIKPRGFVSPLLITE
jgi:universal stress protein E